MKSEKSKYIKESREAFITLRTNIDFAGIDDPIKCVAITSAKKGEGKSTIAENLAIAEAMAHKRTLLIDNDFRNPQLARKFGVRGAHKLSNIMNAAEEDLMEYCLPTDYPDLYLLDIANFRLSSPVEILSSRKYKALIELVKQSFDFVIIDTPPIGLFIDAAIIAPLTDGVLLVIGNSMTTASEEKEIISQLDKAKAKILGTVFNGEKHAHSSDYYYYDKKTHTKKRRSFAE